MAIRSWLAQIGKRVTKDSIKIMELGLKDKLPEAERENISSLSDLYNALLKQLDSHEETLRRFAFALKQLGRSRGGVQCVEALAEHKIERPQLDAKQYSRSVQFFQCLAKICVKLNPPLAHKVITFHALQLGENYKNIPTLEVLFTKLVHYEKITPEDQWFLIQGLVLVSADSCIDYIMNYRCKNNLPEYKIDKGEVIRESKNIIVIIDGVPRTWRPLDVVVQTVPWLLLL